MIATLAFNELSYIDQNGVNSSYLLWNGGFIEWHISLEIGGISGAMANRKFDDALCLKFSRNMAAQNQRELLIFSKFRSKQLLNPEYLDSFAGIICPKLLNINIL